MKKKSVDRRHPRAEHCWPANRHSYYTTGPALRECHTNILLISFKNTKVQNTTDIHENVMTFRENVTQKITYFFLKIQIYRIQLEFMSYNWAHS